MLHLIKEETDDLCLKEKKVGHVRKAFPDEMVIDLGLEE